MKKHLFLTMLFTVQVASASQMLKETIYSGKLDHPKLDAALIVSKFYPVMLKKDKGASFEYAVRADLKNEYH
jgi:sporulation-control protein spo0M